MKKLFLEQKLKALGCSFQREGGNHEIWCYENGRNFPVPRHSDVNEITAKSMIKKATGNRRV